MNYHKILLLSLAAMFAVGLKPVAGLIDAHNKEVSFRIEEQNQKNSTLILEKLLLFKEHKLPPYAQE